MHEGKMKWTIQSSKSSYVVLVGIHQFHNSEIATCFEEYKPDDLSRDIECTEQLRVHIHQHTSSVEMNGTYKRSPTMGWKYCVSSVCYYMYRKSHNTWTSAADACKKHKQQLLTINSDFESNLLNGITHDYGLLDSPVLFLNLRRDSKVCISSYRHKQSVESFVFTLSTQSTFPSLNACRNGRRLALYNGYWVLCFHYLLIISWVCIGNIINFHN